MKFPKTVTLAVLVAVAAVSSARAAQTYTDAVKADQPTTYLSCDDGSAASATPLLNKAAKLSDVAAKTPSVKLGDTGTIEWWQYVPAIDQPIPVLTDGNYEIGVRPLPAPKPKGKAMTAATTRAALAATDKTAVGDKATTQPTLFNRPTTMVSPGKWFHFAAVQQDGKIQLFVNGYAGADVLKSTPHTGDLKFATDDKTGGTLVDEVAVYDRALSPERILAHYQAAVPPRHVVTVGHRGDNRNSPENTNISYANAIKLGTPIVEMDLRLTKDNVLVLSHDATVNRTTNGKGPVVEKTLEEIQKLDAGSWKDPAKYKGEKVPTVETICNTCRDKAIMMLDLKCEGLGESLAALKQKLNFPSDHWILAPWVDAEGSKLRHYLSDVPMIRLTSKIPTDKFDDAYFAKMKQIGFSGFSVQWQNLTDEFIDAAHAHQFKIYCWTVNDGPDVNGSVLAGVDGIITDDAPTTSKLVAVVSGNNK